jgi:hypothetical protein
MAVYSVRHLADTSTNKQIRGPVICLFVINVQYPFMAFQHSPNYLVGNDPVFCAVSARFRTIAAFYQLSPVTGASINIYSPLPI